MSLGGYSSAMEPALFQQFKTALLEEHEAQGEAMPRAIGDIVRDMLAPDHSRRTGDLSYVAEALRSQRRQKA